MLVLCAGATAALHAQPADVVTDSAADVGFPDEQAARSSLGMAFRVRAERLLTPGNFTGELGITDGGYATPTLRRPAPAADALLLGPLNGNGHGSALHAGERLLRDMEGDLTLGLGYRAHAGLGIQLGTNVFYDYLQEPGVQRISVGAEAKSTVVDVYANWYQGLGEIPALPRPDALVDPRTDGWDLGLAGRLPYVSWLELSSRYYRWQSYGRHRERSGFDYRMSLQPLPLFALEASYLLPSLGEAEWGLQANLRYYFGVPWKWQLLSSPAGGNGAPQDSGRLRSTP